MRRTSRSSRCRRPKTSPRPPATCSTGSDGDTAMSNNVLMPALSPTMTEGKIARWLKKEGEKVKSGDVLAEIETDKATMEVEAVDEGTLGKILVAEGTEGVKVNTPIAVIVGEGEDASAAEATGTSTAPHPEAPAKPTSKGEVQKPGAAASSFEAPLRSAPQDEAATTAEKAEPKSNGSAVAAAQRIAPPMDFPEVPEGTEMVEQTVREALRDAMAEEMRRDEEVFVMG